MIAEIGRNNFHLHCGPDIYIPWKNVQKIKNTFQFILYSIFKQVKNKLPAVLSDIMADNNRTKALFTFINRSGRFREWARRMFVSAPLPYLIP